MRLLSYAIKQLKAFVGEDGRWILEEGEFVLTAGGQNVKINCTDTRKWETPNI